MTDLNEYKEGRDGKAWIRRLVRDTNELRDRIQSADHAEMPLPHEATAQLGTALFMAWRSVVRMEMRGQDGAHWRGKP